MLTKQGSQIKEAMIMGAIRAARLSDEDKATLRKEYGLPENPNFKWRNAGREVVGSNIGQASGAIIGRGLGSIKGQAGQAIGQAVGSMVGTGIGAWEATNKYSRGRAEQIRKRLKAQKARLSKTGALVKEALNPEDEQALREYYGLRDDQSVSGQRVLRAAKGSLLGGMAGIALGAKGGGPGIAGGLVAGSITGGYLGGNRFSSGEARRIRELRAKRRFLSN